MFQLQTPNIRFKHMDTRFKGYWGQRSTKVIQGKCSKNGVLVSMVTHFWSKYKKCSKNGVRLPNICQF